MSRGALLFEMFLFQGTKSPFMCLRPIHRLCLEEIFNRNTKVRIFRLNWDRWVNLKSHNDTHVRTSHPVSSHLRGWKKPHIRSEQEVSFFLVQDVRMLLSNYIMKFLSSASNTCHQLPHHSRNFENCEESKYTSNVRETDSAFPGHRCNTVIKLRAASSTLECLTCWLSSPGFCQKARWTVSNSKVDFNSGLRFELLTNILLAKCSEIRR